MSAGVSKYSFLCYVGISAVLLSSSTSHLPFCCISKQCSKKQVKKTPFLFFFCFKKPKSSPLQPPSSTVFHFAPTLKYNPSKRSKIQTSKLPYQSKLSSVSSMGFPHIHMRSKTQNPLNMKLLLCGIFLAFLLLFVLRSNISSAPAQSPSPYSLPSESHSEQAQSCPTCAKLPSSISQALVHYATSNITPQQTYDEIWVSARVLERKSPCNFLVFGLGRDSPMWAGLNHGGRTAFLEEDKAWIEQVTSKFPVLETYHVKYETKVRDAEDLMKVGQVEECTAVIDSRMSKCGLALKGVPTDIYEVEWDLIMVDAPTGYFADAPGRMGAIYTAGMMARYRKEGETDVFVHDVDRTVEDQFSKAFLCEGYMREQEGRLRHFTIPSHRGSSDKPFCP